MIAQLQFRLAGTIRSLKAVEELATVKIIIMCSTYVETIEAEVNEQVQLRNKIAVLGRISAVLLELPVTHTDIAPSTYTQRGVLPLKANADLGLEGQSS